MIVALLFLSLVGWSYWLLFRRKQSICRPTLLAKQGSPANGTATVLGPEDDLDEWRSTRNAWTALDDYQLTRLLTDSAPRTEAPQHSPETPATPIDHGDTP